MPSHFRKRQAPAAPLRNEAGDYAVLDENGEYQVMNEAQYQAQQMTSGQAIGQGFGRTMEQVSGGIMDLLQGVGIMDNQASGITGETMRETLGKVQQDLAAEFAPVQEAQPGAAFLGQALPYLMTAPIGGASVLGQAGLAGTTAALTTPGDLVDRAKSGGIGFGLGYLGAGAASMAGRVYNATKQAYRPATQQTQAAFDLLEQGGRATPAQLTNVGRTPENIIQSAGGFGRQKDINQKILSDRVGAAIGQSDEAIDLSSKGLGKAADDIGDRFDEALADTTIEYTDDLKAGLDRLKVDTEFLDLPDPTESLTGKQYQKLRSQLAKLARFEGRNPSKAGKDQVISDVIESFDDAFDAVAGVDKSKLLTQARGEWRALLAAESGQAVTPDGFVNAKTLNNNINRIYPGGRRGKMSQASPETQAMKRAADTQASKGLTASVGDSGTATRLAMGLGLPAVTGLGTGSMGGDAGDVMTNAAMMALLMRGYGSQTFMRGLAGQAPQAGRSGLMQLIQPTAVGTGRAGAQGLMAGQ